MKDKLFRRTYQYICTECREFSHSLYDYCELCGAKNSLRTANKDDYKE
ncbi:MAG: hypothetical protein ACFFB8_18730 [Promethearchaeota archaeon]